ncbi:MAG: hypothetical protein CM15mP83_7040 [Flavobacteriaceae bacterium]|nr:MAG: hypothetical protein CM15mP83_7040 [Flavobacteriaceae bacterium]
MSQSIAFGSCHKVNDPNSDVILTSIADKNPDAFIWLGDIVYGKDGNPKDLSKRFDQLKSKKHTKSCSKPLPFMAFGTTMIMALTMLDVTINIKRSRADLFFFLKCSKNNPAHQRTGAYQSYDISPDVKIDFTRQSLLQIRICSQSLQ